jgi:hypothetical protein
MFKEKILVAILFLLILAMSALKAYDTPAENTAGKRPGTSKEVHAKK